MPFAYTGSQKVGSETEMVTKRSVNILHSRAAVVRVPRRAKPNTRITEAMGRESKPAKATPQAISEAAYRRFLAQQKEGLQRWAKKRAAQLDSVGMSAEMEVLVIDLLEELREEPAALASTSSVHAGTETLLLRALGELKFVERFARQAVAIVLAREGDGLEGGASLLARPGLLSECLDWLCVHVPISELPLQFRPKLRLARASAPKLASSSSAVVEAVSGGQVMDIVAGNSARAGAPCAPAPRAWPCTVCTFENLPHARVCDMCGAPKPLPPPPTAEERAAREAEASQAEAAAAAEAVARGQLRRLCGFGFARSRCVARLAEAEASAGGAGCGENAGSAEEMALAALLRETLDKLAASVSAPEAATSAEGSNAAAAAATTTATAAGQTAAARAASARSQSLQQFRRLLTGGQGETEAAALREAAEEEEAALEAILGPEFGRIGGGVVQLTLLWDASTGEAPWAFSTAHMADDDDEARAGGGGGGGAATAAPPGSRCATCVLPGCRLPTNRIVASAYCSRAHAEEGATNGHYAARLAGFAPDGAPLPAGALMAGVVEQPPASRARPMLRSTAAAVPGLPCSSGQLSHERGSRAISNRVLASPSTLMLAPPSTLFLLPPRCSLLLPLPSSSPSPLLAHSSVRAACWAAPRRRRHTRASRACRVLSGGAAVLAVPARPAVARRALCAAAASYAAGADQGGCQACSRPAPDGHTRARASDSPTVGGSGRRPSQVLLRRGLRLALENDAAGSGPAPLLYDLLSWFRQELPQLLQRLACVKPPPTAAEEDTGTGAEADAAGDANALDGGDAEASSIGRMRIGTTTHETAALARDSLTMRFLMQSEAQRSQEEAEEAERLRRWEQVKALIQKDEADAAAKRAAKQQAQAQEAAPTAVPLAAESAAALLPPAGRGRGRGRGALGAWPEHLITPSAAGASATVDERGSVSSAAAADRGGGGAAAAAAGHGGGAAAHGAAAGAATAGTPMAGRGRLGRGRGIVMWPEHLDKGAAATAMPWDAAATAPAAAGIDGAATATAAAHDDVPSAAVSQQAAAEAAALTVPPPSHNGEPQPADVAAPNATTDSAPTPAATAVTDELDPEAPLAAAAPPPPALTASQLAAALLPPPLTSVQQAHGQKLLALHRAKQPTKRWQEMQAARAKLPAAAKRGDVLGALESHSVLVVSGETGCGKTTQVPRFILIACGRAVMTSLLACRCPNSSWTRPSSRAEAALSRSSARSPDAFPLSAWQPGWPRRGARRLGACCL